MAGIMIGVLACKVRRLPTPAKLQVLSSTVALPSISTLLVTAWLPFNSRAIIKFDAADRLPGFRLLLWQFQIGRHHVLLNLHLLLDKVSLDLLTRCCSKCCCTESANRRVVL